VEAFVLRVPAVSYRAKVNETTTAASIGAQSVKLPGIRSGRTACHAGEVLTEKSGLPKATNGARFDGSLLAGLEDPRLRADRGGLDEIGSGMVRDSAAEPFSRVLDGRLQMGAVSQAPEAAPSILP